MFSAFPTPCSTGTNFFAQNPCHTPQGDDENGSLFPPTFLISPGLQHIRETGATVTLLVPDVFPGLPGGLFYAIPPARDTCSQRQGILRLLFGPPEHTASQNQNTCNFRGICGPSESLQQIPIESCRVLHLLSVAPAALHSLETCPSSGMPQMSCPKWPSVPFLSDVWDPKEKWTP